MYRNSYQRGMLTVFFSGGSKPLNIWETHTKDGYITRFLDQDIKSMVLEIGGTNVSTTYMTCPKGSTVLGITMPFLVMVVKNLKKYFTFEVTILDETGTRRRFRVSNFQSTTQILPLCTVMPIGLSDGWNQIQFNLAEFTRRAYKKQFVEVQKIKINANIRLRRIYFTERLVPEDQLPPEYKLYFPLVSKGARGKKLSAPDIADKENIPVAPPQATEAIEEKKEELDKLEEKRPSQEVSRAGSKASALSVKKSTSVQGSRAKLEKAFESESIPGSRRDSIVSKTGSGSKRRSIPTIKEDETPEGESQAPPPEGESALEALEGEPPTEYADEDANAPATEAVPADYEEVPPELEQVPVESEEVAEVEAAAE